MSTEPQSIERVGNHWLTGKIYRAYSEQFGTHDLLCVMAPGTSKEDRLRAMEILPSGDTRELLHFSSYCNDRIEKKWDSLLAYYAEVLA